MTITPYFVHACALLQFLTELVPRNHVFSLHTARFRALLYPLCVAAGLCYGSTFALVLALAADLFGSEHVATNYGLLDLGESALGDLLTKLTSERLRLAGARGPLFADICSRSLWSPAFVLSW